MRRIATLAIAVALGSTAALADTKPTDEEMTKVTATAKAWGCTGGVGEKETEGSGIFELNDTKCADGANYDIKMDAAYKVISITAD